jgi:hypothetical protein
MRMLTGTLLAVCLLAAAPSFAGDLSFDNNQTTWHSTKCTKPVPPTQSVVSVDSETRGNAINSKVVKYNAFASAAQDYMDCVSREAENDQNVIFQAIAMSAQQDIDEVRTEAQKLSIPVRTPEK